MTMESFERLAGVHLVHIPYKGAPDVMTDLIAGRTQLAVEYQTVALPHVQAGRLRALAVAGKARKPALPDVPTAGELGLPGLDGTGWQGFVAPAGTPPEIIERLHRDITAAMKSKDYVDYVALLGAEMGGGTPAEFAQLIAAEIERWGRIVKEAGVKVD